MMQHRDQFQQVQDLDLKEDQSLMGYLFLKTKIAIMMTGG